IDSMIELKDINATLCYIHIPGGIIADPERQGRHHTREVIYDDISTIVIPSEPHLSLIFHAKRAKQSESTPDTLPYLRKPTVGVEHTRLLRHILAEQFEPPVNLAYCPYQRSKCFENPLGRIIVVQNRLLFFYQSDETGHCILGSETFYLAAV